jgi:hypothetical protein
MTSDNDVTADRSASPLLGETATQWAVPLRRYHRYETAASARTTMVPRMNTAGSFPPGLAIGDGQARCLVSTLPPKQITSKIFLEKYC